VVPMEQLTALWRRAGEPASAHDVAAALLLPDAYARTRGVAQQAARLARARRLDRAGRRRLLATAWLHDVGDRLGPGLPPLEAGRALRRAGHEPIARLVAHAGSADLAAALAGLPPVTREFPRPLPPDDALLLLLDVALVTTAGDGSRVAPAEALRDLVRRADPRSPAVRVRVALIARLGDDPDGRLLVERVAVPSA
jgi:hypothetical protein